MKTLLSMIILMIFVTPAVAEINEYNAACTGLGLVAEQVMELRNTGATLEEVQYIVNDRASTANISPDSEFAVCMLPEQAYAFASSDGREFGIFIYEECMQ